MDTVLIQVRFTKVTEDGVQFNDALYFTEEQWAAIADAQLEALKTERFESWKAAIAAASQSEPEDPEE